jgi:DNA-binding CsgD family transcriptional regulator
LKDERANDAVKIAIAIDEPLLADRIVAILGDVVGMHLVTERERADVMLISAADLRAPTMEGESDAVVTDGARTSTATALSLTTREREVLELLAEGASNKTIARRLGISVHTAKFHVGSLLDKLDATGRTDAVTHAARLGVIDL